MRLTKTSSKSDAVNAPYAMSRSFSDQGELGHVRVKHACDPICCIGMVQNNYFNPPPWLSVAPNQCGFTQLSNPDAYDFIKIGKWVMPADCANPSSSDCTATPCSNSYISSSWNSASSCADIAAPNPAPIITPSPAISTPPLPSSDSFGAFSSPLLSNVVSQTTTPFVPMQSTPSSFVAQITSPSSALGQTSSSQIQYISSPSPSPSNYALSTTPSPIAPEKSSITPNPSSQMGASATPISPSQSEPTSSSIQTSDAPISSEREARAPQTYSSSAASALYSQALETISEHESSSFALIAPRSTLVARSSYQPLIGATPLLALSGGGIVNVPAAAIGGSVAAIALVLIGAAIAVIAVVLYYKKKGQNIVVPQLQSPSSIENASTDYLLMEDLETPPIKPSKPKITLAHLANRTTSAHSVEHAAVVAAAFKNNPSANLADDDSFDEEYWINLTNSEATSKSTLRVVQGEDVEADEEDPGLEKGVDPALVRCFQTAFNPTTHADGTQTLFVMPQQIPALTNKQLYTPKKTQLCAPLEEQAITDL